MKTHYFYFLFILPVLSFSQTVKDYIKKYNNIAVKEMHLYKIPASITLAQGILESSYGTSVLSIESNNHFGIKCHVDWEGPSVFHDDDEKNECFRKYDNVDDSYRDHSIFLSQRSRYQFLFNLRKTDYKGWAKGLQKAGYATSKTYSKKIITLIEKYNLSQFDKKKFRKNTNEQKGSRTEKINGNIVKEENYIKYVIAKEGELYDDIAERLDVWLWELLKYNESSEDRLLFEGEKVYLQPKRRKGYKSYHIVLEGETMYTISQLYGIQIKHLYKKNRMKLNSEPYIGQKLSLTKKIKFN